MKKISIYIHIPFCEKKCYYCDFFSIKKIPALERKYFDYLIKEINLYKDLLKDYRIKTIFIGGGTPSIVKQEYIERIMDKIYSTFHISEKTENTIEVNPGSLGSIKAQRYYKSGINRISLGAQTFKDESLELIGRSHLKTDIFQSYDILKNAGFENINFDMIYGLPNQSLEDIYQDLEILKQFDLKHISYYGLIIEEGTKMENFYKKNKDKFLNEDDERLAYHSIIETLKASNYIHYEISNFAKETYESLHNSTYWQIKPYIGFGISSHSNLEGRRFWNFSNFEDYFKKLDEEEYPIENSEEINRAMEIAEYSIFGLRFIKGIEKVEFKRRFNHDIENLYGDIISKHIKGGLLREESGIIRLTKQGMDLANLVELDIFAKTIDKELKK